MTAQQTDVLIVGAGPVGIASALMLEKLGVDTMLIERRSMLHQAPQAHVISSRTLEICRSLGIDDGKIRALGPDPMDTLNIRWVDHLLGRDLGVYNMAAEPEKAMRMFAQTPTPVCNLSQDQFEELLAGHLSQDILFNHTWSGLRQDGDGYVSEVTSENGETFEIASRFIIGADGAGSRVRKAIGVEMEGVPHIQSFANIHFHADLRARLSGREGLLFWVMDPECFGTFIAHDIGSNWIFMKTLDEEHPPEKLDEAHFEALLRKAIGADVPLEIQSVSSWVMTAQVASAYQKDGVFLVGDAAHRFPPTGGIGMNTGFQDAHNLAWKIAQVLKGAHESLLDTYEPERRPSAAANSAQSHENMRKMAEVSRALDVDRDGVATMADFDRVLADDARQTAVQNAITHQAEHFNMIGLDLGVCYESTGIVGDGSPPVSDHPITEYIPSTTPGARLPHCWLERAGRRLSTLDLVQSDRFLVLTFADPGSELTEAVDRLKTDNLALELVCLHKGAPADDQFDDLFSADKILLVRPDGHIAARMGVDGIGAVLEDALAKASGSKSR